MVRLLTDRIPIVDDAEQDRYRYAHYHVATNVVKETLQAALREDIPPSLEEIAARLGYRGVESLRRRCRALYDELIRKRQSLVKRLPSSLRAPVPRDRIEQALAKALNTNELTPLRSVANAVGLRTARRFYKDKKLQHLRCAIVAKNKQLRQQRMDAIESALRAAFDETPLPTVADVARRLGLTCAARLTSQFPNLAAGLRRMHRAAQASKRITVTPTHWSAYLPRL
jgi:hypothetical protein